MAAHDDTRITEVVAARIATDVAETLKSIASRSTVGVFSRVCRKVDFTAEYSGKTENRPVVPVRDATVITSQSAYSDVLHYPVIDLDLPARLIPSSTPGHYHLYLDTPVDWGKFVAVLDAMVDAGLVEGGYVEASKERGHTCVRLPWVGKLDAQRSALEGAHDALEEALTAAAASGGLTAEVLDRLDATRAIVTDALAGVQGRG